MLGDSLIHGGLPLHDPIVDGVEPFRLGPGEGRLAVRQGGPHGADAAVQGLAQGSHGTDHILLIPGRPANLVGELGLHGLLLLLPFGGAVLQ